MESENDAGVEEIENAEATRFAIILVGLIDISFVILSLVFIVICFTPEGQSYLPAGLSPFLAIVLWLILYSVLTILIFNGTIGMQACNMRLLNGNEEQLSFTEKILAALFVLYNGVTYYYKRSE